MEENKKTTPAGTEVECKKQMIDYHRESLACLFKQMNLLAQRSCECQDAELAEISKAMIDIYKAIF